MFDIVLMGHKLYVKSQIKPYLASRQIPSLYILLQLGY